MRTGRQLRRARPELTVRDVLVGLAGPRRRSGAVLIEDETADSSASSPTATSPGSSSADARPTSTDRSARS